MRSVASLPEYTTVVAQTFSAQFYAAATRAGEVAIWRIGDMTGREAATPFFKFKPQGSIHSLVCTERYLLTGGTGEVLAWSWEDLARKSANLEWSLIVPGGVREVNSMIVKSQAGTAGHLLLACGDCNIYMVDMETRRILQTLSGHTGYVHCIADSESVSLISGGEEGALKMWDIRSSQPEVHTLLPHKEAELARPTHGQFISAVAASGDWVACGGGPAPSLWNLGSRSLSCRLPGGPGPVHAVLFLQDHVLVGGQGHSLHQANFSGELVYEAPVQSSCVYSLATRTDPDLLAAAGASARIDVLATSLDQKHPPLLFPV